MDPENDDDLLELDGFEAEEDLPVDDVNDDAADDQQDDDAPDDAGEDDNAVIRSMRAELRAARREARELRKKSVPAPAEIGERPRYGDGSKWDFDEEKYETALDEWMGRKLAVTQAQPAQQDTATEFDRRSSQFTAVEMRHRAEPVKAKALDDVGKALGPTALATITWVAADKGPDIMLKLARDPDLMDRVADIAEDPIMLAAEIGRLSAGVTTVAKPDIDKPVRGGRAAPVQRGDARLAKLEKEAEKTGDRTALIRYRKQMAQRSKV